jgi:membrane protein
MAWIDDYAPSMGAAISYYTVFSLAPLLVIVIAIAGAVFGREAVQGQISAQLSGLVGAQGAKWWRAWSPAPATPTADWSPA